MKRYSAAVIFLLLFLCSLGTLGAQSLSSATGAGGNQLSLGFGMENLAFEGLYIDTGTVIEDYLYLGIGWNLDLGVVEETAARQSVIRGICGIPLLSQDEAVPVSVLVTGVYEKITTSSEYLDSQSLIRTGTGFDACLDIFRDFVVGSSGFILRTDLSGIYSGGVLITEPSVDGEGSITTERYSDYLYGIKLGVLYALNPRLVLSLTANAHLDGDFNIHYGAIFTLSSPEGVMSGNEEKK